MIFTKPKSEAAKQLTELERAVAEKRRRQREVDTEHGEARHQVARLQEQLTEAYAEGKDAAKLQTELAEARRALKEDWPPRLEGARRAIERAVFARQRFIGEHFGELSAELLPEAEAAADAVQDAIDALHIAQQKWATAASRFEALMREVPGIRAISLPGLRLGDLDSVLAKVDGDVPVPAPRIPADLMPEGTPESLRLGGAAAAENVAEAV